MVIAILGILAALAVPIVKDFNRSNAVVSATRQLMDDVAAARQRAIANRSEVYMVFLPPDASTLLRNAGALTPSDRRLLTNLLSTPYSAYALFCLRQVGDQPGRPTARYLTDWKTLPDGTFIATNKFSTDYRIRVNGVLPFQTNSFPFPSVDGPRRPMPYIGFDYQGGLLAARDNGSEIIPLARGTVYPARNASGQLIDGPPRALETPPGNSITLSNHIRIDGLTGRARNEHQQVQ